MTDFARSARRGIALATALCSASCAGSGGGPPAAPAARARAATVTVRITWPQATASARRRRPDYISTFAKSLTIDADGSRLLEADNPTLAGSPPSETYSVELTPANHTFVVKIFDRTAAAGNLLGRATTALAVQADVANVLPITVDGQLAHIAVTAVANPALETVSGADYTLVGPQTQTFVLTPEDADGGIIVSPGAIPPLTLASASGAVTATAVAGQANAYAVAAPAPTSAITLTASGTNLDGLPVTATFTVQSLAELFVSDRVAHTVSAFDEAGRPIALGAAAFPDLVDTHSCGPMGLTYAAATTAIPVPHLFVTRCVAAPASQIATYDLAGNELSGPQFASSFPMYLTPLPKSNALLATIEDEDQTIETYAYDGSLLTSNAGPHPRAFEQANSAVKVALDPTASSPNLAITDGTGYVELYDSTGANMIAKTAAGFTPVGITFDSHNGWFYVATYASMTAVPTPQTERATVFAYDAATLTQQTTGTANALAFMGINRASDILYDPYAAVLFVADYAGHAVLTFKEDGSSGGNLADAITSVTNPTGLALAP